MAENRCNEMCSSSTCSSPNVDSKSSANGSTNRLLNAPKYGTPVPNRVFVGGIPSDANETEVRQLFAQYGNVTSVKIINDRAGIPRGYGFVTYEFEDDAKKVLQESDNLIIKDRKLNVSVAIKKQQQMLPFEIGHRLIHNGSLIYNPFSVNAPNSFFVDGVYPAEGIPLYQIGVNPQYVANAGTAASYPYAYQNSNLYLAAQPQVSSFPPQYPSHAQNYQFGCGSIRLPITSQNNMGNVNSFVPFSSATSPPLSTLPQQSVQIPSSLPVQVAANHMTNAECAHNLRAAVNTTISPVNIIQAPLYALSSNIPQTNSNQMACVQNVQLKATDNSDMCSDNNLLPVEIVWPQRVPNIQCPNKSAAINRNHNALKSHNNANITASANRDKRNYSSVNASQKRITNNYTNRYTKVNSYAHNRNMLVCCTEAEMMQNELHLHQHQQSNQNNVYGQPLIKSHMSAPKMQPFVATNIVNTQSHTQLGQQLGPKQAANGQTFIPKLVNGVQIYALANVGSGGECDYANYNNTGSPLTPLTPPLTPGSHPSHSSLINSIHKT